VTFVVKGQRTSFPIYSISPAGGRADIGFRFACGYVGQALVSNWAPQAND
jgi:hypothetical protein